MKHGPQRTLIYKITSKLLFYGFQPVHIGVLLTEDGWKKEQSCRITSREQEKEAGSSQCSELKCEKTLHFKLIPIIV